jgi:GxxExxY protein
MVEKEKLEQLNKLSDTIIGAAIEVHKFLGPGLLESVYEICLIEELEQRGLKVQKTGKTASVLQRMPYGKVFCD